MNWLEIFLVSFSIITFVVGFKKKKRGVMALGALVLIVGLAGPSLMDGFTAGFSDRKSELSN
ncbi:hypothetical protein [Pleionea sediminis]|uniref:hypothetical protein n=1 Tax=Pleionea sediminis TaxID=2569479 RepID=UPI0011858C94|nr:hypothetical protein [Pleionea sediminis]